MSEVLASAGNQLFIWHEFEYACETIIPCYGTIDDANKYFDSRLASEAWDDATVTEKRKALITATRAIDRLNFEGSMVSANQFLQFPRGEDVAVPSDIKIACYEEALKLLDGFESDKQQANLSVVSQGISSARTTYDRSFVPDHQRAGITSAVAWQYLQPYLRDWQEITLSRV